MKEQFSRTTLLLGKAAVEKLQSKKVAVFGVGGVGGFAVEALARAGIGALELIDSDTVSESNINRQIIALHSTVGKYKTEVAAERIKDINPDCKVTVKNIFYLPETADEFDFSEYDYVVDAVDTVTAKIDIICRSKAVDVPIISAMGAGNKLDPLGFKVADISKTKVCPLARVMRQSLKKRNITSLKTVYSEEMPIKNESPQNSDEKRVPGSVSFVPSTVGLIIASEVIKDLLS